MDDDRRFLYTLIVGGVISGLLFWLAFWHGHALLLTAGAGSACALLFFRLRRHRTPRELKRFKAAMLVFGLVVIAAWAVLAVKGIVK